MAKGGWATAAEDHIRLTTTTKVEYEKTVIQVTKIRFPHSVV